mmetsp:Transcript_4067/g.8810  ORF Transcript_4067/g.8810 Transcript_4067/m.8810 type:complete len:201 (-) Transcript_4067:1650-2252(-)
MEGLLLAPLHFDVDLVRTEIVRALRLTGLWIELAPITKLHLADAAEAFEVGREVLIDLRHHLFKGRLPLFCQLGEASAHVEHLALRVADGLFDLLDVLAALLVLLQRPAVVVVRVLDFLLKRRDLGLELVEVVGHAVPRGLRLRAALAARVLLKLRRGVLRLRPLVGRVRELALRLLLQSTMGLLRLIHLLAESIALCAG